MLDTQKELATKAVYAAIGAPVVVTRQLRGYGDKLAVYSEKVAEAGKAQVEVYATEGEKLTKKLQGNTVVGEIQSRVDLDKVTDRVEKLRDQLEAAMQSWRESFTPGETKTPAKKVEVETDTAPKTPKPAARKSTTGSKSTGARKTTAKASTAKETTSAE